jgi:hypothetical protein
MIVEQSACDLSDFPSTSQRFTEKEKDASDEVPAHLEGRK